MDDAQNETRANLRKALEALQKTRRKLEALEAARHEPIAVIGMACRFPGAASPEAFWELLAQGRDMVTEIPPERWDSAACYHPPPARPGCSYVRAGAFLEQPIDLFDPQFFGISPREAMAMDPQQRLLLEVSWEALERAGQAPAALRHSRTAVFVGVSPSEYLGLFDEPARSEAYATTGNAAIFASGRLAYLLGLQGPNLVVDTACSASLIAVHLACESLRNGSSDMALAGGVHLMLSPQGHIVQSQLQALAPDGRCKTFDAAANGYGRGEGCGVLVLKRLSDAQRDGDPILALVRGSAINHDGPSSGLTVPSATAQAALIRAALANANLTAQDVSYVEAHGTGTPLGDPIELRALTLVFGQRAAALLVGSVKTNIGHLEEAAGIAGLIKVILALQHGQIPPHLHFQHPNPHIDWDQALIRVPCQLGPWPAPTRIAGVSSFGLGGSNAHVLVEQAPPQPAETPAHERPWHLLVLSARSPEALQELARRYQAALQARPDMALADVCFTAAAGRNHLAQRLSLTVSSLADLQSQLAAYLADPLAPACCTGVVNQQQAAPGLAFLFTGQGAQYLGMGRELYASQPTFRAVIDRCDAVCQAELGRSLVELLYPDAPPGHNDLLESHPCGQAVTFALECALAELWRCWGVQPTAVLGHSLGDFAAAYSAGVVGLEDGLRLVIERGRLMERAAGSMISVLAAEDELRPLIAPFADVAIGAVNGPRSLVLSGGHASIDQLRAALQAAGFSVRRLAIPVAAHSPLLDPVLDAFEAAVRRVRLAAPRLAVVSSMTGRLVASELTDPAYWRQHLRQTIRFADGLATLHAQGCRLFVEIGPRPTLLGMAGPLLDALDGEPPAAARPLLLPSLREGQSDWQQLLSSLGALYVRGIMPDWPGLEQPQRRRKQILPTAPFQRQRCWLDPASAAVPRPAAHLASSAVVARIEQGQAHELVELLQAGGALSDAARAALPEVIGLLLAQHRQAPQPAPSDPLYELAWHELPQWGLAPGELAGPDQLAPQLRAHWQARIDAPELRQALAAQAQLDQLCVVYVLQALAQAGLSCAPGVCWQPDQIARALGLLPAYERLLGRLLELLAEAGILTRCGQGWQVLGAPPRDPWADRAALAAAAPIELTLLERCGPRLGALLRGQHSPLELLFQDATSARLYRDTPSAQLMNGLLHRAVEQAVRRLPPGRGLRILEIGAGTGGTTAGLLPLLPPESTRYVFTDKGSAFLNQARARFADYAFVRYQTLDIEEPPARQGYGLHQYDLVIAANVLHATSDLRTALAHARALLAPDGLLLLLESTAKRGWVDLTFGLTEGWWRAADQRQGYPLLSSAAWQALLAECGFQAVECSPDPQIADAALGQVLLLARAAPRPAATGRHWLILGDPAGLGQALADQLAQRGETPICVTAGAAYRADGGRCWVIDPHQAQDYQCLLADLPALHAVVHLLALDSPDDDPLAAARQSCGSVLHLVQALARAGHAPALWLATRDARAVQPGDPLGGVLQSPLWGLGRVLALEHPELRCVCVDLDAASPVAQQARALAAELLQAPPDAPPEDQIAWRGARRYAARLVPYQRRQPAAPAPAVRPDATYLITGGLGGLGLSVARWLVQQGARRLVLLGRSPPTPQARAQIQALQALGAHLTLAQADVTAPDQLAAVLAQIDPAAPLAGVVHAAAASDPGRLIQQDDWQHFSAVLRPKLLGAWHLEVLTQTANLDFFVCFSSITSLVGDLGLGAYAAANSLLDALALRRRAGQRAGLSINWGIWAEVGAAADLRHQRTQQLVQQGHGRIAPAQGLAALGLLLGEPVGQAALMPLDWDTFGRKSPSRTPLFAALRAARIDPPADPAPARASVPSPRQELAQTPPEQRPAWLTRHLAGLVALVLRMPADALDPSENLLALGFDSLMAVELRNHIRQTWGLDIPFARFLQGLTLRAIVAELLAQHEHPDDRHAPHAPPADAADLDGEPAWISGTL